MSEAQDEVTGATVVQQFHLDLQERPPGDGRQALGPIRKHWPQPGSQSAGEDQYWCLAEHDTNLVDGSGRSSPDQRRSLGLHAAMHYVRSRGVDAELDFWKM